MINPEYWQLIATISATMIGFVFIGTFYYLESGWRSFKYFQGDLERISKNYAIIIISYFSTALALSVALQDFFPTILSTVLFGILLAGAAIATSSLNSVFSHFESLFGERRHQGTRWLNWIWFLLVFIAPLSLQAEIVLPSIGDIYLREETAAWIVFMALGIGYWNLLLFLLTPYQMHKRERDEEARQNKLAAQQGESSQTWDESKINHARERVESSLEEIGLTISSDLDTADTYREGVQLSGDLTEPHLRLSPKITEHGEAMAFVWIPDDWSTDENLLHKSSLLAKVIGRAMWKGYRDLTGIDVRIFRKHQPPWKDTPSTDMLLKVHWEDQNMKNLKTGESDSDQILESASSCLIDPCLFPIDSTEYANGTEDILDMEDNYKFQDVSDKSHGAAKRYSAIVILQKELSTEEIKGLLPEIIEEVREKSVYKNKVSEDQWKGKDVQVVWIHLFNEQKPPAEMIAVDSVSHYVGKAEWFDPNLDSRFTPHEMRDPDGVIKKIRFKWSSNENNGTPPS